MQSLSALVLATEVRRRFLVGLMLIAILDAKQVR